MPRPLTGALCKYAQCKRFLWVASLIDLGSGGSYLHLCSYSGSLLVTSLIMSYWKCKHALTRKGGDKKMVKNLLTDIPRSTLIKALRVCLKAEWETGEHIGDYTWAEFSRAMDFLLHTEKSCYLSNRGKYGWTLCRKPGKK